MRARSLLLEDATYDHERNYSRNGCRFNFCVIFPKIIYQIVSYARAFLSIEVFFKCYLKNTRFQLQQIVL